MEKQTPSLEVTHFIQQSSKHIKNVCQVPVTVSRHQQKLVGKQNHVEDSVYQCKRVDSELEKGWVL